MNMKLLLTISSCALVAWTAAQADGTRHRRNSANRSQHQAPAPKAKAKARPAVLQVPAIGTGDNPQSNPIPPSPDAVIAAPVALERHNTPPPPANLMSRRNISLSTRETAGVAIARNFANNRVMPSVGEEGVVVFPFGETMPSIVCAPLMVCDIALQAGEIVNDINVGDSVRWRLSPATSGSGASTTTHVIIKPIDAALQTNAIITTDRRTYALKLVSRRSDYMARVSFTYQDDTQNQWRDYRNRMVSQNDTTDAPATLNFNYTISGDRPAWRPVRTYNDGSKTYIEFPTAINTSEAPALLVLSSGNQEQLVNYRVVGTRYVVDKLFDRAELIDGIGRRQTKVTISREN